MKTVSHMLGIVEQSGLCSRCQARNLVGRKLTASRFKDQPFRKIVTVYSMNKAKHMNTLCGQSVQLLGVFAQLQNPTNSFVTSVSFSVCKHTHRFLLDGFSRNLMFRFFFCWKLSIDTDFSYNLIKTADTWNEERRGVVDSWDWLWPWQSFRRERVWR